MNQFLSGFENIATADLATIFGEPGTSAVVTSMFRSGSRALQHRSLNAGPGIFLYSSPTLIMGFAFRSGAYDLYGPMQFYQGGVGQVSIRVVGSGQFAFYKGDVTSSTALASGKFQYKPNQWYYVEAKITFHQTSGRAELRVNGQTDIVYNGNTDPVGTSACNIIRFGKSFNTAAEYFYFDDVYVNDSTGTTANDFEGDCKVVPLRPNRDGYYSDFTPNAGTVHFNRVRDTTPDGDSTYNASNVIGHRDSYGYDQTALNGSIRSVQATHIVRKDDAGSRTAAPFIRLAGQDISGSEQSLNNSWNAMRQNYGALNPLTGQPWTVNEINELEAGLQVVS